jgi:hypothetical protein
VEDSCEHGNEPLGFIKSWEFLEWLHNWRLLKKGSAPLSYHVKWKPQPLAACNDTVMKILVELKKSLLALSFLSLYVAVWPPLLASNL